MKKSDIAFLNQLVNSLEDAEKSLEKEYQKNNYDKFNKTKKIMLKIQKEILEMIK